MLFHFRLREKASSCPGGQGSEVVVCGRFLKAGGLAVHLQRNERFGQAVGARLLLDAWKSFRFLVDQILEEVRKNVLRTTAVKGIFNVHLVFSFNIGKSEDFRC